MRILASVSALLAALAISSCTNTPPPSPTPEKLDIPAGSGDHSPGRTEAPPLPKPAEVAPERERHIAGAADGFRLPPEPTKFTDF